MYRSKTVYEKRFPREDPSELYKEAIKAPVTDETEHLSFDKIMQRIYKNTVYVSIPWRKKKGNSIYA